MITEVGASQHIWLLKVSLEVDMRIVRGIYLCCLVGCIRLSFLDFIMV